MMPRFWNFLFWSGGLVRCMLCGVSDIWGRFLYNGCPIWYNRGKQVKLWHGCTLAAWICMPGARDKGLLVLRVWTYAIVSAISFTMNSRVSEHCNADHVQYMRFQVMSCVCNLSHMRF